MAEPKTKPTKASVRSFIAGIEDPRTRKDCNTLVKMMKKLTKATPKMWGETIVGFGTYHYKYESGREGDWLLTGFSPRKNNVTLYLMAGFEGQKDLLKKLGKHKTGKSCLYIKRLDELDVKTLERLVRESIKATKRTYPKKK